jgi:hypothetical protein
MRWSPSTILAGVISVVFAIGLGLAEKYGVISENAEIIGFVVLVAAGAATALWIGASTGERMVQ